MSHDVFISHSSKDKNVADAVVAALEAAGITCWVAPRDIAPGMDWGEAIVRGIAECKLMVLVYSGNSNRSLPCRSARSAGLRRKAPNWYEDLARRSMHFQKNSEKSEKF